MGKNAYDQKPALLLHARAGRRPAHAHPPACLLESSLEYPDCSEGQSKEYSDTMSAGKTTLSARLFRTGLACGVFALFAGFFLWQLSFRDGASRPVAHIPAASEVSPPESVEPPKTAAPAPDANPSQTVIRLRAAEPSSLAEASSAPEVPPEKTATADPAGNSGQAPAVAPLPASDQPWRSLIQRLAADGFDEARLRGVFSSLKSPPRPEFMGQKAVELYARHGKASLAVSGEGSQDFAPPDYTRIAGGVSVAAGRRVINDNARFFAGLHKRYGVPAPFIIAILMVETGLGAETGRQSALLALGSMAVTDSLEQVLPVVSGITSRHGELQAQIKARSDWAYNELKALLAYARALRRDPATIPGSVYGAIGFCQFMPSNIPVFGASSGKAGSVPDLFNLYDASASVARYLSAHGWKKAQTARGQIGVLHSYNHSDVYAATVYGVATSLMSLAALGTDNNAGTGRNAVKTARESARATIPANTAKAKPIEKMPDYKALLH
ncbi:MAG: lytic murein transglycosylase [Deltaproteobacteria bacterium]|jgi:membrane-bound lytic murein transglycosylase B|nr:lytic murein transglycosylase [Deltaproteobacteria bacterium]